MPSEKLDTQKMQELSVDDDLTAPVVVADTVMGAIETGGLITFSLAQTMFRVRSKEDMKAETKVVLRLAIPVGAFPDMVAYFRTQVREMLEDGRLKSSKAQNEQVQPEIERS
ncbi:MAG: hypothetical protein GDA49_09300 [Rhodospirillales bacterium]|nr:hypothetical protein [Rhodospirillales bacterium]